MLEHEANHPMKRRLKLCLIAHSRQKIDRHIMVKGLRQQWRYYQAKASNPKVSWERFLHYYWRLQS